jgi:hypothetical protein
MLPITPVLYRLNNNILSIRRGKKNMQKKVFFLLFILLVIYNTSSAQESCGILRMKDGQIKSHPIFVFVEGVDISKEMQPVLCLVAVDQKTKKIDKKNIQCKGQYFEPFEVSPGQTTTIEINGSKRDIKGTIMLFDINNIDIPIYHVGMRAVPVITWIKNEIKPYPNTIKYEYANVIGDDEIYIGNSSGAIIWTILILIIIIVFLRRIIKKYNKKFFDLIKINDGGAIRYSLSLTQMALWTLVVGVMILLFGFMYLKVPDIPDTLIVLMGLSIITGSAGNYQNKLFQNNSNINTKGKTKGQISEGKTSLYDLIAITTENGRCPSIAKAQHLFFTVIIIVLFVVKSILDGELWPVPEELVFLMGISQGSHIIRNQIEINAPKPQTTNNNPEQTQSAPNAATDKPNDENASGNN